MGRTLLAGDSNTAWREWLKHHGDADLVHLDPSDAHFGPAGRLLRVRSGKVVGWRFYGSLDARRAPHLLVAGAAELLAEAGPDAVVQLFPLRRSPLLRQLALLLDDLVAPERILTPEGAGVETLGWSIGPESVARESAFPEMVRHAQRKAQWLRMLEEGTVAEVPLATLSIRGARLGSGHPIPRTDLDALGLVHVSHAELCGKTLLLVAETEPDDASVARALDRCHAQTLHRVPPGAYAGLLAALGRDRGEPLAIGRVETIDFRHGVVRVRSTMQEGAGARTLLLGGVRLDEDGNEGPELRPWQV
ncbi:MAG: hypothetical protein M9921_12705 [Fimbriimonadaceae bacterium]|nr:hypothetical protein [Chthonomonadaceae bacterium]MCO5297708.1 hypothetical protein [Fimbriimonadaceae bacterium]